MPEGRGRTTPTEGGVKHLPYRSDTRDERPATEQGPLLRVEGLRRSFSLSKGLLGRRPKAGQADVLHAVNGVSFEIPRGETLGLAGESGSGKSTTGELLVRLQEPTDGRILFDGSDVAHLRGRALKEFRRNVQMVFQDPYESLNPRFTIFEAVAEPLRIHGVGDRQSIRERVIEALEEAELRPALDYLARYPHELSGGQRQRVAIAKAIVLKPAFIVADEPVSMLDVSVRAGVLNLLKRLQADLGLTMLYVSHDLATVKYLSQRMATMYLGNLVEVAPTEVMPQQALHPYTQALFAAVPVADPESERPPVPILGDLSVQTGSQPGCPFAPRCPKAMDHCRTLRPELREFSPNHYVSCHLFHDQDGNRLSTTEQGSSPAEASRPPSAAVSAASYPGSSQGRVKEE